MDFIREFTRFILKRKKFFLLPVLLVMVLIGGLVALSHGSAIAPFIYTIF